MNTQPNQDNNQDKMSRLRKMQLKLYSQDNTLIVKTFNNKNIVKLIKAAFL
jgi:hypothetical protein